MPIDPNQPYATPIDLQTFGLSASALNSPATGLAVQEGALLAASRTADAYLLNQYDLPLSAWSADLTQYVCWIAAYSLMGVRGYNPAGTGDSIYADRYKAAIKWLEGVAKGDVSPQIQDSAPEVDEPGGHAGGARPVAYSPQAVNSTGGNTRGTGCR